MLALTIQEYKDLPLGQNAFKIVSLNPGGGVRAGVGRARPQLNGEQNALHVQMVTNILDILGHD